MHDLLNVQLLSEQSNVAHLNASLMYDDVQQSLGFLSQTLALTASMEFDGDMGQFRKL